MLFQQMGVQNLRLGGGTADGCGTPVPQYYDPPDFARSPDINQAFEFARSADVKVIYTLRMVNHKKCFIPDLASQDARYARFIWNHYRSHLQAFSLSNETDFHSAHTFCRATGQCTCAYGVGCSGDAARMVISDPLIYETAVPGGRSVAGTAFPSYLADWISFATVLRNPVSGTRGAPLAGPDSGDYTGGGGIFPALCWRQPVGCGKWNCIHFNAEGRKAAHYRRSLCVNKGDTGACTNTDLHGNARVTPT
jgi:hypothetical protein